jgi:hypothetical protein
MPEAERPLDPRPPKTTQRRSMPRAALGSGTQSAAQRRCRLARVKPATSDPHPAERPRVMMRWKRLANGHPLFGPATSLVQVGSTFIPPGGAARRLSTVPPAPRSSQRASENAPRAPRDTPAGSGNLASRPRDLGISLGINPAVPENSPAAPGNSPAFPGNSPQIPGNSPPVPRNSPPVRGHRQRTARPGH